MPRRGAEPSVTFRLCVRGLVHARSGAGLLVKKRASSCMCVRMWGGVRGDVDGRSLHLVRLPHAEAGWGWWIFHLPVEEIQRISRVREWTPQNAPRIRAGATKKDQKTELKKKNSSGAMPKNPRFFFQTTGRHPLGARRETTEVKTRKMLGPLPCGPQRTGRADQRDARGDANRDRSTQNHRRPVLLCATQRPRSTNNETTTTTRHRELRDPRPTHLAVDLGDWGLR